MGATANLRDRLKVALTNQARVYDLARRPYAVARYRLHRPHDASYAAFGLFEDRAGLFLDVGANAGMSAMSFRIFRPHDPILSIEPNPFHRRDLDFVGRLVKPFRYRICAAGSEKGVVILHVPVFRHVPLTTEASLCRKEVLESHSLRSRLGSRMDGPDFEIEEVSVGVLPLDELQVAPAFIKLDTEGTELAALRGLRSTIENHLPVLMVETPDAETTRELVQYGYKPWTYDPATGRLDPGPRGHSNVLFTVDRPS